MSQQELFPSGVDFIEVIDLHPPQKRQRTNSTHTQLHRPQPFQQRGLNFASHQKTNRKLTGGQQN
jgi:hypothetical protein